MLKFSFIRFMIFMIKERNEVSKRFRERWEDRWEQAVEKVVRLEGKRRRRKWRKAGSRGLQEEKTGEYVYWYGEERWGEDREGEIREERTGQERGDKIGYERRHIFTISLTLYSFLSTNWIFALLTPIFSCHFLFSSLLISYHIISYHLILSYLISYHISTSHMGHLIFSHLFSFDYRKTSLPLLS